MKRVRGPGLVYTSVAIVATLLLGVVALDAGQESPPTVAEFAPSALDQITKQPTRLGHGVGASNPPTPSPTPTPTPTRTSPPPGTKPGARKPPPIDKPQVRECFGDPPRQIPDPQSPPCVPYWKGDNGGATTFGVTANEIRVAVPQGSAFETPRDDEKALANYFNEHFEFYGRKIRLVQYYVKGDTFAEPNPPDMIADARYVKSQAQAFASLGYQDRKGAEMTYYDELARLGVISVVGRDTAQGSEAHFRQEAPYEWSQGTAIDTQLENVGQFTCAVLAGRPAAYGGPYSWTTGTPARTFGILVTQTPDGTQPDWAPLRTALGACGVKPFYLATAQAQQANDAVNPMVQMSQHHVSTLICLCDVGSSRNFMDAAAGQSFYPEWEMSTYLNNDLDNSYDQVPLSESRHVIGISFNNKYLGNQKMPWWTALREGDPSASVPTGTTGFQVYSIYEQLLTLASGIQMAGPHLTPQTFQTALQRTAFPNPDAGAPPYYQARVGFTGGLHAMKQDAAMFWYDPSQQGTENPQSTGAICWVDHGVRFGLDGWRRQQPRFGQGACL